MNYQKSIIVTHLFLANPFAFYSKTNPPELTNMNGELNSFILKKMSQNS